MRARTRRRAGLILAVCLSAASTACADERSPVWEEERPPAAERVFRSVVWDTLFRLGGSLQDTLLQAPSRMAADPGGVYVADRYAGRLIRVARDGHLLWTWGRRGKGPEELEQPRHLIVDPQGRVWILDLENARAVVVGPDGHRQASLPLAEVGSRPDALVPRSNGGALVLTDHPERPIVIVDSTGRIVERRPFPWPGFRHLHPLASQMLVAFDPADRRWVAALSMADGFFTFERLEWLGVRGWYVESVPTTRGAVERRRSRDREQTIAWISEPHFAAVDIAMAGDRVLVLFHGKSDVASRVVDIYAHRTGEYLESLLLPTPVAAFAYADSVYYGLVENPYPSIVAWRPRSDTNSATGLESGR